MTIKQFRQRSFKKRVHIVVNEDELLKVLKTLSKEPRYEQKYESKCDSIFVRPAYEIGEGLYNVYATVHLRHMDILKNYFAEQFESVVID